MPFNIEGYCIYNSLNSAICVSCRDVIDHDVDHIDHSLDSLQSLLSGKFHDIDPGLLNQVCNDSFFRSLPQAQYLLSYQEVFFVIELARLFSFFYPHEESGDPLPSLLNNQFYFKIFFGSNFLCFRIRKVVESLEILANFGKSGGYLDYLGIIFEY